MPLGHHRRADAVGLGEVALGSRGGTGCDQRLDFGIVHAAFLPRTAEPHLGVGLQQPEQGARAAQRGAGPCLAGSPRPG